MNPTVTAGDGVPAVRAVSIAVGVALAGLAAGVVLSIAAGLVLRAFDVAVGLTLLIVLSLVLMQGVAFGGVALGYLRARGLGLDFLPARVPSFQELLWVASGYVLALAAAFLGAMLVFLTGASAAPNQISRVGIENPELLLALVPLSFLLIAPGEELLFRGVVQGTLRESFGPVVAVGLASAIFAAVHVVALSGTAEARLVTVGVLFLPSLVFGTAYEITDNLVVPSLIHGAYNATLFSALYLAVRFGSGGPAVGLA